MEFRQKCALCSTKLAFPAFCVSLLLSTTHVVGQDDVVYPANSEDVSYAALDEWPDFRGIWHPAFGQVSGGEPELKGQYKTFYEQETAKVEADPTYEIPERQSNCEPPGMPYMMTMPYSLEFLFTPGKIVIIQEALMQVRRVYLDGRPFPDNPEPTYFGYSRGHWEGDTLVIETIGLQEGQRLGRRGITNSEDLKITERIYLDDDNKDVFHLEFTYEDPNVLEEPWIQKHTFRRDREWEILEYVCAENNRHILDEQGQTRAVLDD